MRLLNSPVTLAISVGLVAAYLIGTLASWMSS